MPQFKIIFNLIIKGLISFGTETWFSLVQKNRVIRPGGQKNWTMEIPGKSYTWY